MKVQNSNEHKTITKALDIPILYVQLVAQLVAEDLHGDDHDSHEALRRQSYTRQVLDQFGKEFRREFKAWKADPQAIHSKVFNPILQWYLRGVPDRYTPAITAAISGEDEPTIHDVSSFYLAKDPVDPNYASTYSQNLLYIPESRWYLAVLMGKAELKSVANFDKVRVNHDNIMEYLAEDNSSTTVSGLDSYLNEVEIRAIFDEGLEDAFEGHLGKHEVVRILTPLVPPLPTLPFHRRISSRKSGPRWQRKPWKWMSSWLEIRRPPSPSLALHR